jgi:hypothetical protein
VPSAVAPGVRLPFTTAVARRSDRRLADTATPFCFFGAIKLNLQHNFSNNNS